MYVNRLVCVVQSLALMVEVKQDQDMIYIYIDIIIYTHDMHG